MPKPCSLDLRIRLLDAVIAGASRREAADCFDVSASSASEMAATLGRNWKYRGHANWGEYFAVGRTCGLCCWL